MKKSLTMLGIGAGLLVGLTSCQSTPSTTTGGYEEAIPMSELAIADGELPPWVLEGSDTDQVPAGDTTARNQFAIPEPDETIAANTSSGTSQNQPEGIAAAPTDDTVLEDDTFTESPAPAVTTTHSTEPRTTPIITHRPVTPTTSKPVAANTPKTKTGSATSKTKGKTALASTKSKTSTKKAAKVDKPTMVVYKVRPGDNLSDIAKRSGTSVAQIRKDSGIKGDIIHPGQTIKVRYTPKGYVAPKPQGKGSKVTTTKATAPKSTGYTVKTGDTISGIAKKNGISTAALLAANGMKPADAAKLRSGRSLVIPGKAAPKPAAKATAQKTATTKKKKK